MPTLADRIERLITRGRQATATMHTPRRRAHVIALHVGDVVFARPHQVDHAELVAFLYDLDPEQKMRAEDLTDALIGHFDLRESS